MSNIGFQIENLQEQMSRAYVRIDMLEKVLGNIPLMDAAECNPTSKTESDLQFHLTKAAEHAEHLEAKIKVLKEERAEKCGELGNYKKSLSDMNSINAGLHKQVAELSKELAGWHELFATKHLSHAKCLKASRDLQFQNQREANDWQADRIKELNDQLANQGIIIKEYREKYESGCSLVSKMHAAAMGGKIVSPKQGVVEDIEQLRLERDAFKSESDDQAKAWAEIRTFIPDVNGLSLVGMVRRHVEELTAELAALKANNRYQSGYEDGAQAVIKQVRDLAAKLHS